jgi:hypothetical protein
MVMYQQSHALAAQAWPSTATLIETDGPSDTAMARMIRTAKEQSCFADGQTLDTIRQWPDFDKAREELFCSLIRLSSLLPGDGLVRTVREAVANAAPYLGGPDHPSTGERLDLYKSGKRALNVLCRKLDADQRPSTIAAACRELHPVFGASSGSDLSLAFTNAMFAVMEEETRGTRTRDAGAPRASVPAARPTRALVAAPTTSIARPRHAPAAEPPKSTVPALSRILARIGTDDLEACRTQLSAGFDRLVDLIPPGMDPSVRQCLVAWRARHATPPPVYYQDHPEMLYAGRLVITALCNVLGRLAPANARKVFDSLEEAAPTERGYVPEVRTLFHALIHAEGLDAGPGAGQDNPNLEERERSVRAWAGSQPQKARIKREDIYDVSLILGLENPDTVPDTLIPAMSPIHYNAAWRAALEGTLGPIDAHSLADVGVLDLALVLDELQARCDDLMVDQAGLDRFSDRWLVSQPTGSPDDKLVRLQGEGVDAMRRICSHLKSPGERPAKQAMLASLLDELAVAEDPTPVLRRRV